MSLFSWFSQKNSHAPQRDSKEAIAAELKTFNKNTMWPIAKVRPATTVNQLNYINSKHKKFAAKPKPTLENDSAK